MKIDGELNGKDIMICNTYVYICTLFCNTHYITVISEKPSAKILGKVPEMKEIEGLQYVKVYEEKSCSLQISQNQSIYSL